MGYEYLDISGEAGVRAVGGSLEELFESAALGMYGLSTDLERIREEKTITTEASGQSVGRILVAWLNELIFHLDTYGFVGKKVRILKLDAASGIRAEVSGEEFDPERHERRLLLKAATYHDLKVEQKDGEWTAEVIFDI